MLYIVSTEGVLVLDISTFPSKDWWCINVSSIWYILYINMICTIYEIYTIYVHNIYDIYYIYTIYM